MNDLSPSAGVDVGSLWLDLGFHPFAKPIRAPNTEAGIETILAAVRERGAGQVAIEAIGGYARKLAMAMSEAEVKVFLVNPRRIKAFRDAEGLTAKTDKLDASLIARFAHAMAHELRPLTGRRARDPEGSVDATAAADGIDRHREDAPQTGLRPVDPRIVSGDDRHSRRQAPNDRSRVRSPHRGRRQNGAPARHSGFDPGIATRISTLVVVEMPELGLIDRKAAASPGGPCAPSLAIRPGSRTQRHLRRPSLRALSLLHGRARRGANPSPLQAGLPRPARRRKTRKSRPRRRRSTHRHPRQRPPPRRHNLQKRKLRLTSPIQSPEGEGPDRWPWIAASLPSSRRRFHANGRGS